VGRTAGAVTSGCLSCAQGLTMNGTGRPAHRTVVSDEGLCMHACAIGHHKQQVKNEASAWTTDQKHIMQSGGLMMKDNSVV